LLNFVHFIHGRVHTDPGKVWKVLEFKVQIFKTLKSMENDHRYGKVWKSMENCYAESILRLLVQCNRVNESVVDEILRQYSDYATAMLDKERDRFVNFDPITSRVDSLMHETLAGKDMYRKLWNMIRLLLVLSHGQASVKRGFSINKQTEEVNLQAETFVAKRIICDHVRYLDGIDHVDVTCKELLLAATGATQKYNLHLEEVKKKAEAEQSDKKRKAVSDQIEELRKKKARLQQDISSLDTSEDTLLTKAESKRAIKYVTEANSLRRTVKEKTDEVKTVELQLDELLLQLRNN